MIERIGHAGLVVSDLERSIAFYTGVLGLEVSRRLEFPGRKLVILSLGDERAAKLELLTYVDTDLSIGVPADRTLLGLRHLAFRVPDVSAVYEHLMQEGVQMIENPPFQRVDGPRIAFGLDPDGVLLEFTEID